MLEITADGEPFLIQRFLNIKIIADNLKYHIQVDLLLLEVSVDLHVGAHQIVYGFLYLQAVLVEIKGLLEMQPSLIKFIHFILKKSFNVPAKIVQ
jgi:hypothetical protein